ncbi:hypothetical protein IRJ41_016748 [Triplophysa rosa]|uniref:Uncharacterized protein n=1 Tax=Triplophysa rosa TaxID=992332 RepID=A0A9W7WFR7_TRIRA|nr:hypothetical protein IRJ41_016748 [Triplophysa rosa]
MARKSAKRSKNKLPSGCLSKRTKGSPAEEDPESENIPPCSTPIHDKSERDIKAVLACQTPSHLNITAAADHGSPVTAPTITNTSVTGNLTINQNFTMVLPNNSGNKHLAQQLINVKDGADERRMLSCKSEYILQKSISPQTLHRRRCLDFAEDVDQPTLTLAEVKKNTNHLREITVDGKILETRPTNNILISEEEMTYSHYALCDNTATVPLILLDTFTINLDQWYTFKSISICDFGQGNVLCSTELTTLESFTPVEHTVQEPEETVISGEITGVLVTFEYLCSCDAVLLLPDTKLFHIKCNECKKSCRCASVRNRAKAEVTIKQASGTEQMVVLNDALLHSIDTFKKEGFCDSHRLEERLLRAKTVTVVCVDSEPQRVQMDASDKSKGSLKFSLSGWQHACLIL